MNNWDVSESASRLHREALVCDMTLPWGPGFENREITLPRFSTSGFDFVPLSVGHDGCGLSATLHHIGAVRKEIEAEPDQYMFVQTVSEIRRAKAKGKLALGFHFQGIDRECQFAHYLLRLYRDNYRWTLIIAPPLDLDHYLYHKTIISTMPIQLLLNLIS